ncbi:uncharacterized protein BDW70DRAFT_142138 [Aspergillus foveolatus]|uniref:uncharacterized protein n=1 Tax=Aspergillus foveolatus TaxID=210207 RepID=UPI003CCCC104
MVISPFATNGEPLEGLQGEKVIEDARLKALRRGCAFKIDCRGKEEVTALLSHDSFALVSAVCVLDAR